MIGNEQNCPGLQKKREQTERNKKMTMDIVEVKEYIKNVSATSKIYIGCDSERFKAGGVWYADYATVVVVHIDGKHGCKIFGDVKREQDYDRKVGRPAIRLMNEVYKVQAVYELLRDVIGERYCEIHLDINPDERFGSSCVVTQAIGYIVGTCNMKPKIKPFAFAASIAADRYKELAA
jgi:predicted RNase H-related nuclease YkuK (DUF458 family)